MVLSLLIDHRRNQIKKQSKFIASFLSLILLLSLMILPVGAAETDTPVLIPDMATLQQLAREGHDERSISAQAVEITPYLQVSGALEAEAIEVHATTQLIDRQVACNKIIETYSTTALANSSSKSNSNELGNVLTAVVTIRWTWEYSTDPATTYLRYYQFNRSEHKYIMSGSTSVYSMFCENMVYQPGNLGYDNSRTVNSPSAGSTYTLSGADHSVYPGGNGHGYAAATTVSTALGSVRVEVSFESPA